MLYFSNSKYVKQIKAAASITEAAVLFRVMLGQNVVIL